MEQKTLSKIESCPKFVSRFYLIAFRHFYSWFEHAEKAQNIVVCTSVRPDFCFPRGCHIAILISVFSVRPFKTHFCFLAFLSRTKNQPKEEVFGTDIVRTSGGHSRGYPDPKLRSGQSKSWKNKHLGADIHDPKARTSTTLRDSQKLRSGKLWAEFSFPILGVVETVILENGVFAPCRKQVVLTKIGENSDISIYPQKQGRLLLRPRKSTKMTKMAGVTQVE